MGNQMWNSQQQTARNTAGDILNSLQESGGFLKKKEKKALGFNESEFLHQCQTTGEKRCSTEWYWSSLEPPLCNEDVPPSTVKRGIQSAALKGNKMEREATAEG